MKNAHNDNEPLTFQTLAAATARLLGFNEKRDDRDATHGDEKQKPEHQGKDDKHTAYVEHRLRELNEFEQRASGDRKRR